MAGRRASILVTALAVLSGLVVPGTASGVAPASPGPPVRADRDGDRIFEDLEARLGGLVREERVPVIVVLDDPPTDRRLESLVRAVGRFSPGRRFTSVDGFSASLSKGQILALARLPGVVHVEEDSVVRVANDTAQSGFGVTKARLDAPTLDGDGDGNPGAYGPADLVAAVLDTGIDPRHLDLDGGKVLAFKDLVNGRTAAYDDNGHGTHVAATIAGDGDARTDRLYRGVAPAAGLVGVKILNSSGSGSLSGIAEGLDWVVANREVHGIEAVNLSLGGTGCSDGTDAASRAVDRASDVGLVVVVAAGNSGPGRCTVNTPGTARGAITVGAMADLGVNGFRQASFSGRGPTADGRIKPDLSGPGMSITSARAGTTTGYVVKSGTSMATPFVAGVALLLRDANPLLTPAQVRSALTTTAQDWARGGNNTVPGTTGPDIDYGAGRLDAYAALRSIMPSLVLPPSAPVHRFEQGSLPKAGSFVDHPFTVSTLSEPIAATLLIPGIASGSASSPDFDLYLYGPDGKLRTSALTSRRQEDVGYTPNATGTYTLRVRSYAGSGGYVLDRSGGGAPVSTASVAVSAVTIETGKISGGGSESLGADDNAYLKVGSTTSGTRITSWSGTFAGVPSDPDGLTVTYKGKNSRSCTQTIWIRRVSDGAWVKLDSRSVGTSEVKVAKAVSSASAYVTPSGDLSIRVRCQRSSRNFTASADLLQISYTS